MRAALVSLLILTFCPGVSGQAIHAIQGGGPRSPLAGSLVTTRGIVTATKSNGFFIQTPDAEADADPATSEGLFVFTGGAPPAAASPGNLVQVTGTVVEFVPAADRGSPPLTELGGSISVSLLSTGHPLPVPVTLSAVDTRGPEGLERFEGMRVRVASLDVVAPTGGSVNETNGTSVSNGVFYGVIPGLARPRREPGIPEGDPLPPGAPCCIPRFDTNPERIRVDSDAQPGASAIEAAAGDVVRELAGPLDFAFRTYTILPDASFPPGVARLRAPAAVSPPGPGEFTVASYNLERFFDDSDDPARSEPVLTRSAFETRLAKASLAVREWLRMPDIAGVVEIENLAALQRLARRINEDAVAAGQPDPQYEAFLEEGNDPGGIDAGLLVKRSRVGVRSVVQELKSATFTNPAGQQETLFDRPPLRLDAEIGGFAVTILIVHLRSLSGIDDPSDGPRVRLKRQKQAEAIASLVQSRQNADRDERIAIAGDFNAFEFNDGYADVMGTIAGRPAPADQVLVAGPDLVDPDLTVLTLAAPAPERYSFVIDGNAEALDHVVVNRALLAAVHAVRVEWARINADFPESARNDAATPVRLSDHDPVVAFFRVAAVPPRRRAAAR
ncbi:MAG TPA: hypothetical protein VNL91_09000 [Thermoanaerobaculia bacterium]|nr:hypothetical protein [Thermoanaerobaculia bacterium]